jgi:phosphate transport system substrate-binding protein
MRIHGRNRIALLAVLLGLLAFAAVGCGGDDEAAEPAPAEEPSGETTEEPASAPPAEALAGEIEVDGSSTVGPLVQAGVEAFREGNPDVDITVGISGTGGGFERFCAGETDISNASRPIKDDEPTEGPGCAEAGIEYIELQVAVDALTVVVNPENDWASCLTVEQLNTMWAPEAEGTVTSWSAVDPSFPDEELILYGAGTDSGTFDYFTDAVNGEEGASRADYNATEDDNVTVEGVAGEAGALGYFGFSYYEQNLDRLKAVEIDGGSGCVAPSAEAAQDGSYAPLARPLFVYVKKESLARPEVAAFVSYLFENNQAISESAQFIPLNPDQLAAQQGALEAELG